MGRLENNEKYILYMQTSEWKAKANQRKEIDNFECVMYGSLGELQVHHISYKRLGREDIYKDLVTVCPRCHVLLHNYYRRVKSASSATEEIK